MTDEPFLDIGEPAPLFQVQALVADLPAHLSDKKKGRIATFAHTYEMAIRAAQRERYVDTVKVTEEARTSITERIEENTQRVEEINAAVSNGLMEGEDGRKALAVIFRDIAELRERTDALEQAEAEGWSMVSTDPEVYQIERLERFPTLVGALPRITEAWLNGDDYRDPLAAD